MITLFFGVSALFVPRWLIPDRPAFVASSSLTAYEPVSHDTPTPVVLTGRERDENIILLIVRLYPTVSTSVSGLGEDY